MLNNRNKMHRDNKELEEAIKAIREINKKLNTQFEVVDRRDMPCEEKEKFLFVQKCCVCEVTEKCQACCDLFYCESETHCTRCNEFLFNFKVKATEVLFECEICSQKCYYCGDERMRYYICTNKKCGHMMCDSCSNHYIPKCPFCRCTNIQYYDGDAEEVRKAVEKKTEKKIFFNLNSTIEKERGLLGKKRIRTITKEELEKIKKAEKAFNDETRRIERRDQIDAIRRAAQSIEEHMPQREDEIDIDFAAIEAYEEIENQRQEEENDSESDYDPNLSNQSRRRRRNNRLNNH